MVKHEIEKFIKIFYIFSIAGLINIPIGLFVNNRLNFIIGIIFCFVALILIMALIYIVEIKITNEIEENRIFKDLEYLKKKENIFYTKKLFVELKKIALEKKIDEKTLLNCIDMLLEVLAENNTQDKYLYIEIHNNIIEILKRNYKNYKD